MIDSVINYVKQEDTNYAILINGEWGCGKTYFWNNVLKNEIENIELKGKKQKTAYLSLYGVTSIEEINKRIVVDHVFKNSETFKSISESKWGGKLTELGKMAVGVVKKLEIPIISEAMNTEINYENLLNFNDTVLCFDDLERANCDIADILGYINNFVEHDGVKVIIIGNEDEISTRLNTQNYEMKMITSSIVLEKEGAFTGTNVESNELIENKLRSLFNKTDTYKRIKEKLIGKTLSLNSDYTEITTEIIQSYQDDSLRVFLMDNLSIIETTSQNSGTKNIRILKQALDDFKIIYGHYNEKYKDLEGQILSSILKFTLAASFEIKTGIEESDKLEVIKSNSDFLSHVTYSDMIIKNKPKDYIKAFKIKYFNDSNNYNDLIYFKFSEILVRKGIFNVEIFENEMNAIKIQFKDDTPSYIKLLRSGYMVLDDDVFIDARDTAYRKLINGEMKFTWYFKAFVLYRELIKVGLFKKEISELKQELYEGLQKAGEQATDYVDSVTLFWGYEVNPEDSDLQEFNSKTVEINRALLAKKEFNDFNKLIEDLNKNFQQFVIDVNGVYYNTPVFSYCNMDELSHKIIKLSNRNIGVMIDVFEKRYNDLRINSECRLELDNLKKLGSKFNTYIQSNELTPKTVLLKEFSNVIKNINSRI
ncbi:P-loop NTPase fold protein [Bacillus cereus group sp. RP29]|uniref:P-loop NTPase fold protein n=1 Tax=Bacillus cereus group TaxID=86661 RepID=UPI001E4046C8|nr:P-loop NTPase fold protein [Bacillus cereus]MDA1847853.1 P-loop NTPase fold protein [Bacillus cereus]